QVSVLERVSPLIETSTSWAAGVVAVAMILRLLAPVPLRWVDVLVGGAITAALIVVGTELLGLYLDRVATASLSGAAGALALFLIWLYYEAQIILVGAELTKVLSDRRAARSGGAGTG
ncbi:MAG: YhjD/YihY/BrkB family envelope integrity protein, partial [Actinomycetota bacterium]